MNHDGNRGGAADRQRIDIHQDRELRAWAKRFGVTEQEICDAVAKVGVLAEDVQTELRRKPRPTHESRPAAR